MSAKKEADGKSPSAASGGSAVDLDSPEFKKVLEKVDKESTHRELGGWQKIAISIIALAFSVFHIYTGLFGQLDAHLQRAVHLAFVLTLVYLLYPASKRMRRDRLNPVDLLFVALSLACLGLPDRELPGPGDPGGDPHAPGHRGGHRLHPPRLRGGPAHRGPAHDHHRGRVSPVRAVRRVAPRGARAQERDHPAAREPPVLHHRGHVRHPAGRVGLVRVPVPHLRRLHRDHGHREAVHRHRQRHRGLGLGRPCQGRRHHERPGGHGRGKLGVQRRGIGELHDPDDEEAGLQARVRGRRGGGRVHGRADHAPDHGRGRVPHGGVPQHPLPRRGQGCRDPRPPVLLRHLRGRALRGEEAGPAGAEQEGAAEVLEDPRRGGGAPDPACRHRVASHLGLLAEQGGARRHGPRDRGRPDPSHGHHDRAPAERQADPPGRPGRAHARLDRRVAPARPGSRAASAAFSAPSRRGPRARWVSPWPAPWPASSWGWSPRPAWA